MARIRMALVGALLVTSIARGADGPVPTADEMATLRQWVAARFEQPHEVPRPEPGLLVLANNDPVIRNARGSVPLKIADKQYTRGLYCHAVSKVVVRLPGPGKTFSAVVGIDSNSDAVPGRGSVVFSVTVAGKQVFKSEVLREGLAGVPVSVDLAGASEFVLDIGDAGDGISFDQSDWADAKVELADGKTVWLGDLAFLSPLDTAQESGPPFSFVYGGTPSSEFLGAWTQTRGSRPLDDSRTEHTLTWTDPKTGLLVRCVAVEYRDFPTVEWTLHLRNTGPADSPLLENVLPLDVLLHRADDGEFVLHHHTGSPCSAADFQPRRTVLAPKSATRITTSGGRPTNSDMPYFNIAWPSRGLIAVLGWPGQWAARFTRDDATGLRIQGGQELTRFKLLPGEEVRTPLVVLQFWKGDRVRAQNVWRRWMLAHNAPRPAGKPMPPILIMCCNDYFPGMQADEPGIRRFIDAYLREKIPLDYWWIDAGWYPCDGPGWPKVGTWEPDPKRFPRGLRPLTDYVHAKGVKMVVWFEPERVHPGTWLYDNHPEWLLGKDGDMKLLNLGLPEARRWLTAHVDGLLTEQGIDLYRQDFNMEPLGYWRANDPPDRQGITEIRHVEGYLAYWDELRRRHPGMPIDTCASGGRRLDLETLRRAVPLLRSDYRSEPVGTQGHTYGLSSWIPYYGTGVGNESAYVVRSHFCPCFGIGDDARKDDVDWAKMRKRIDEWRKVVPFFLGDYYPLSAYSLAHDVWMAWQFDRPDLGEGVVQAFRRDDSPYETARFRLGGLQPDARYVLTDLDSGAASEALGRDLMEKGLTVSMTDQPGSVIITYKRSK